MNRDLAQIAEDMDSAAWSSDTEGLCMAEYDDYGFPDEYRQRVQWAMDRWDNGRGDMIQAAQELAQIAKEMPGDPPSPPEPLAQTIRTVELP